MIRHCVFCKFKDDVSPSERIRLVGSFKVLVGQVDGLSSFVSGTNLDFEAKSAEFTHGFIVEFEDKESVQRYAEHPVHQKLGAELVANCEGGSAGIIVFDLQV